jgi:phosphoribosylformylglycinamidine cyclo-ligase
LVLSPTRTYLPVAAAILNEMRAKVHGMVHCSGGGQTKVLHFTDNVHVIKDNLFATPPLFRMIQEESKTEWKEMYRVFNMGHRLEIYTDVESASRMIEIARSFHIDAQIVGRVEPSSKKMLTIRSEHGEFIYES